MSGPTSTPDGTDVVADRAAAAQLDSPPLLVVDEVTGWLDERGLGMGALTWQRIGDGQSNITYLLQRDDGSRVVLRRGPRPPLPPSTHDMLREARFQEVLAGRGVPVPRVLGLEESSDLLGVPFYVMEHIDGVLVTGDTEPRELAAAPAARGAASAAVVDTLVALHTVDVTDPEVSSLGRPAGYLERQVRRFTELWPQVSTRELPDFNPVADALARHLPEQQRHAVVHGDFRLGNLMLQAADPTLVAAVLDWEMGTLGDPLADLGYLTATWSDPQSPPTVMDHSTATREPGWASRDDLVKRYADATGAEVGHLPWFEALALWKSAVFCEAIRTRWLRGERPDDTTFAPRLEAGVPDLLRAARLRTDRL